MRRIEFRSVELSHFRCFNAKQSLTLSPANQPGLWFLRGENRVEPRLAANGAGKSSVFMGLTWCIYGRTPDALRAPDLKPWSGNGTPFVRVEVEIDGELHTIERTAKTNGLRIDGSEVGPEAAAELLGLSFEVFINTVFLAQGLPLFFDRSPKEKMELFSDVLRLERWEERSAAAGARAKELDELQAELEGETRGVEGAVEQTEELLERAKEAAAAWDKQRAEWLSGAEKELKKLDAALIKQTQERDDAALVFDGAVTELRATQKLLRNANSEKAAEELKLARLEAQAEAAEREVVELRSEFHTLGKAKTCPACGQEVRLNDLRNHKAELGKKLQEKAEDVQLMLQNLEDARLGVSKKYAKTVAFLEKAEAEFQEKADKAEARLTFLRPQVAEFAERVNQMKAQYRSSEEQRNPHTELVSTARKKLSQQKAKLSELGEDLLKAAKQIEAVRFWVKGFKDVKLYLIQEVLEDLQLATNSALAEVGLEGWESAYAIEKESKAGTVQRGINISIRPAHGYKERTPVKWEAYSGGEGQRLRIVGALALSEILLAHAGVWCNLEILDEPTRHLSVSGAGDLCEYLRERADRLGKTIWFIDHLTREASQFTGVVTVRKTAKGSVIDYGVGNATGNKAD